MSTLAQRQWRQRAQTAVRVAVTASKEARSRFQALSDAGDAALSSLVNCALSLSHLPALRLPGPLAAMRPDVRAAAAAKLARQQEAMLAGLQERCQQLGFCVEALQGAVASLEEVAQDEPWMRSSPVFHTMPLGRVQQLIRKVLEMYQLEYDSKVAVAAALRKLLVGPAAAAEASATAAGGGPRRADPRGAAVLAELTRRGGGEAKRLPDLCTTYLSVWMLSPYLEDEQADEALGAISEDMVSF